MDGLLYDSYEFAVTHSTADQLPLCPPLNPLPRQVAILHETIAWARAQGCRFPAKFAVRWVEGRSGICPGCITAKSPFVITLDGRAFPLDLRRTIAHELRHLHDFHAGQQRYTTEQRITSERRCDLFAQQCSLAFAGRW